MTASTMPIRAIHRDGVLLVTIMRGDARDALAVERLGDALYHLVKGLAAPRVVLDLQRVEAFGATWLSVVCALGSVIGRLGGELRIVGLATEAERLVRRTRAARDVRMHATEDEAVTAMLGDGAPGAPGASRGRLGWLDRVRRR